MTDKVAEAKELLKGLGLPKAQQNDRSALTLLALARVAPNDEWAMATATSLTIRKGIMDYVRDVYGRDYAENSRESFRRFTIHQFEQAGVVVRNPDDPTLPTNSALTHYRLTPEALAVIRAFGSSGHTAALYEFVALRGSLAEQYAMAREQHLVPVRFDGGEMLLSVGPHNQVERAVVEQFAPRFAPGARVLYVGDTAVKAAFVDADRLGALGFDFNQHAKLPDVVLLDEVNGWLFLIEAVTSHGPMNPKRVAELRELFGGVSLGLVFVSAFPDRAEYRKHQADIAWETEVWMVDEPSHMVHYNGGRFLGPYEAS